MWRRIFHRTRPDPPPAAPVDYTRTLREMVATEDLDERVRLARLLGAQIQQAMGRLADNTQVAVWQVEEQWRGLMQEQFGVTNEMIAQNAAALEVAKAERARLRADLAAVSERLTTANNESIAELRASVAHLDARLTEAHQESLADRGDIRAQIRQLSGEVALFIPPAQIYALITRLAELERREQETAGDAERPE